MNDKNIITTIIMVVVFGFMFIGLSSAQDSPHTSPNLLPTTVLEQWFQELERTHPALQALSRKIEAQKKRVKPARTLPDPRLSFTIRNAGNPLPFKTLGNDPMSAAGFQFEQPIPWKGKLRTRAEIQQALLEVIQAEWRQRYWELRGDLIKTSFSLAFSNEHVKILEESQDLLKQLIHIAEALYSVGKGAQSDVLRAYTELSQLDEKLYQADRQVHTLIEAIRQRFLIPVADANARFRVPENLPPIPDEKVLYETLQANAPAVQRILKLIFVKDRLTELRRLERYPDFALRAGWFTRGALSDIYEVGIGIQLPLYAKSKQIPLYEAEDIDRKALEQELEDLRYRLRWRIQDDLLKAETAERIIRLYRDEILPQAQADFESTLDNYQTGRVDFLNVIDRWLRWLQFRVNYYQQLTEYYQMVADLEEVTGLSILYPEQNRNSRTPSPLEYENVESKASYTELQPVLTPRTTKQSTSTHSEEAQSIPPPNPIEPTQGGSS